MSLWENAARRAASLRAAETDKNTTDKRIEAKQNTFGRPYIEAIADGVKAFLQAQILTGISGPDHWKFVRDNLSGAIGDKKRSGIFHGRGFSESRGVEASYWKSNDPPFSIVVEPKYQDIARRNPYSLGVISNLIIKWSLHSKESELPRRTILNSRGFVAPDLTAEKAKKYVDEIYTTMVVYLQGFELQVPDLDVPE